MGQTLLRDISETELLTPVCPFEGLPDAHASQGQGMLPLRLTAALREFCASGIFTIAR